MIRSGRKLLVAGAGLWLLSACANLPSPIPDTSFAPGRTTEGLIAAHYRSHANEDYARCNRPYFDAITKVDVIEESADRLVLELRYSYRDGLRSSEDRHISMPGFSSSRKVCHGFESRRFTLEKNEDALEVVEMTGPVRGQGNKVGNVTVGGSVGVGIGGTIAK